METFIHRWLAQYRLDAFIAEHVAAVLVALPEAVRQDLMGDPGFVLYDYEPGPSAVMAVPVRAESLGHGSRSVVLKRTLRRRPASFVRWLIAHELAHAHLRNAGRFPGDDPEHAADALAAAWGFPRPASQPAGAPRR